MCGTVRSAVTELLERRALLTVVVLDPPPTPEFSPVGTVLGDQLLFTKQDSATGTELWISDGTANGTHLVKDIYPGPSGSAPGEMLLHNGNAYFAADDGVHGRELWKSDGTAEGTVLVSDLVLGANGSGPGRFTEFGDVFLFRAGWNGAALWRSNGTESGTTCIGDWSASNGVPETMAVLNGRMLLRVQSYQNGFHREELWATDESAEGASLISEISNGYSRFVGHTDTYVFFASNDGLHGNELWKTDGTATGTVMVKDIAPGRANGIPDAVGAASLGEHLFFTADDGQHGPELWVTDGTESGTSMVSDVLPGPEGSRTYTTALGTVEFGDAVYFYAYAGDMGLWRTNGTSEGTTLLNTLSEFNTYNQRIYTAGDQLAFIGQEQPYTGDRGDLWRSDGTPEGTQIVPGTFCRKILSVSDGVAWLWRSWTSELVKVDLAASRIISSVAFDPGAITVTGTATDDEIRIGIAGDYFRVTVNNATRDYLAIASSSLAINGLAGNDRIIIDPDVSFAIHVDGGEGNDTVVGGSGADEIHGGLGNDWIAGLDGADTIYGDGGNDTVFGGPGADSILLGNGDDLCWAGRDNDTVWGGAGRDTIVGDNGDDWIAGETGFDVLNGGADNDTLYGGPGCDILIGLGGDDVLHGGLDSDWLYGGYGSDIIYGEGGSDTLWGGMGNDTLDGGVGSDALLGEAGDDWLRSGGDNAKDIVRGGTGTNVAMRDSLDDVLGAAQQNVLA